MSPEILQQALAHTQRELCSFLPGAQAPGKSQGGVDPAGNAATNLRRLECILRELGRRPLEDESSQDPVD
jgi:hypothetical protein